MRRKNRNQVLMILFKLLEPNMPQIKFKSGLFRRGIIRGWEGCWGKGKRDGREGRKRALI
jgi:hypothetical protein